MLFISKMPMTGSTGQWGILIPTCLKTLYATFSLRLSTQFDLSWPSTECEEVSAACPADKWKSTLLMEALLSLPSLFFPFYDWFRC